MKIIKWELLPAEMQTEEVRKYYDILKKKRCSLFFKRAFDLIFSVIALILLLPVFIILAIAIKLDSRGPVFYRQERVTQYGRRFRIHKFRTMVQNADKGSQVTVNNDSRITRVGKIIRDYRLDEIAQLLDVIQGTVTLVGVRPESPKYVAEYTDEMMATRLYKLLREAETVCDVLIALQPNRTGGVMAGVLNRLRKACASEDIPH